MKLGSYLFVGFITIFGSFCVAYAAPKSSLEAQVIGLENPDSSIPQGGRRQKRVHEPRAVKVRFNSYVPGLGRARFVLDREKLFSAVATVSGTSDSSDDTASITLLQGNVFISKRSFPTGASVYEKHGRPMLFLGFMAKNIRGRGQRYYRLEMDLTKPITGARIRRSRRSHETSCEHSFEIGHHDHEGEEAEHFEAAAATSNGKVVALSLDADAAWYGIHGSSSNAVMSSIVNEVDAIYREQLGISFDIVRQNVYSDTSFGSKDASAKLSAFQLATIPESHFGNANLYHLFTGEDLKGSTIGVAYLGPLCVSEEYSFGLSQFTSDATTVVTFAHEIGHNFGANHTSSGIMTSSVSYPIPDSFSDSTLLEMQDHVDRFGSCLANETDSADAATGSGDTASDTGISLSTSLSKQGEFTAEVSLNEPRPDCTISLRGSKKKSKVENGKGTEIISFQPSASFTVLEATINRKSDDEKDNGKQRRAYFTAELVCPDAAPILSEVTKVKPSKVKSSKSTLTVKKWVKKLRKEF